MKFKKKWKRNVSEEIKLAGHSPWQESRETRQSTREHVCCRVTTHVCCEKLEVPPRAHPATWSTLQCVLQSEQVDTGALAQPASREASVRHQTCTTYTNLRSECTLYWVRRGKTHQVCWRRGGGGGKEAYTWRRHELNGPSVDKCSRVRRRWNRRMAVWSRIRQWRHSRQDIVEHGRRNSVTPASYKRFRD